jgi:ABC-type Zn uptake system ZnuABC Zn-binding protein ZnuA
MKRKYLSILLIAVMAILGLAACGQNLSNNSSENGKIKVVTTIFPEYDWVKQIAGEQASDMDITMLLDNGVDLHSYQPTAADIMKISDCDLFIYVGACYHCKCEKCGKLIHLQCDEVENLRKHMMEHHSFEMNPVRTVFYGICSDCRK